MRETGERFICDRCKKELFIGNNSNVKVEEYELPRDWGLHYIDDKNGLKHLCPDCYGTYNVMIADFMALREIKVVE